MSEISRIEWLPKNRTLNENKLTWANEWLIFKDLIIDETTHFLMKGVGPDILCASKIIFSISGTIMWGILKLHTKPKETKNE